MRNLLFLLLVYFLISPSIQSKWIHCGPSDAFTVESVVYDPGNPQQGYIVGSVNSNADGHAAWRTYDGGISWRRIRIVEKKIERFAINPETPNSLYCSASGRIYRSDDKGRIWTKTGKIQSRSARLSTYHLVVDPNSPNILYAALGLQAVRSDGEVYKSSDGGKTWTSVGLTGSIVYDLELVPGKPFVLNAATSDGLFRSDDGGISWIEIGPPDIFARHMTVTVHPAFPKTILEKNTNS